MKKYLFFALFASAAVSFTSCQKATESETLPEKQMCLQLYSIREVIGDSARYADNHEETFKQLKEMGYSSVETANYNNGKFYGVSPEQFKADCEAAGLEPLSAHSTYALSAEEIANHDFENAMLWWDEAIAAHKAAGMSYIVTPWSSMPTNLEEAQTLCDYHNAVGKKCAEAGLKYGYHTHSQEFDKIGDTDVVWMEYLVENTLPENMFWQLDVYLAVKAGKSPVYYLKKYPGRFTMMHIKDMTELGQSGMVDLKPIFAAADEAGLVDYVVEQEGTDGTHTIMEGVAMDADYMRGADFVKADYRK